MKEYLNEMKKGYKRGRTDSKNEIESIKKGEGVSVEYSFRLSKSIFLLAFLIAIPCFFLFRLYFNVNLFLSLILTFFAWWFLIVVLGIIISGLLFLIAKSKK